MEHVKRIRRSAAMWRELFSRQASSGLSVPEFCRREGINASLFWRWRSSLKASGKVIRVPTRDEPAAEAPVKFIDLGGIGSGGPRFEVNRVAELTPRLWKQHFAANPLRSDIHEFPRGSSNVEIVDYDSSISPPMRKPR
jgi:hypothetical protein